MRRAAADRRQRSSARRGATSRRRATVTVSQPDSARPPRSGPAHAAFNGFDEIMPRATRQTTPVKVRLDRWLWAARFYKTRSAAKAAIEGGKVHCGGQRAKPSKEVERGHRARDQSRHRRTDRSHHGDRRTARRRGRCGSSCIAKRDESIAAAKTRRIAQDVAGDVVHVRPPMRPDRRGRRELMRLKQSASEEAEL